MGPYSPDILQEDCTLDTCSLIQGLIHYQPSISGNVAYLSIFGILLVLQTFLGIYYRTWGFLVAFFCGTFLEVLGYVGRIWMHSNPFIMNPFLLYLICLTLGPAFLSAGIYLCLGRLVTIYGTHFTPISPRTYTLMFITSDFISLSLQGAGGGISATATTASSTNLGVNIMIAGLSFQVFSLAAYIALCLHLAWRVRRSSLPRNPVYEQLRSTFTFKAFLLALAVATLTIFVRCVFRVAELEGGFDGSLANNQTLFMILEAPMIIVALTVLSIYYPGRVFGTAWNEANFSLRGAKDTKTLMTGEKYESMELVAKKREPERAGSPRSAGFVERHQV